MTGRILTVMAIGVLATGCLSIRTNMAKEKSSIEGAAELERCCGPATVSLRDRIRIAANDSVAGRVRVVGADAITVQPYLPWEPELVLPTYPGMPVLQGNSVAGTDVLRAGADVRAFVDAENGEFALVAVEVLTAEEAARISSGLSTQPLPPRPAAAPEQQTVPPTEGTRWEI